MSSGNGKEWAKPIRSGRDGDQGGETSLVISACCHPAATGRTWQQWDLSQLLPWHFMIGFIYKCIIQEGLFCFYFPQKLLHSVTMTRILTIFFVLVFLWVAAAGHSSLFPPLHRTPEFWIVHRRWLDLTTYCNKNHPILKISLFP